MFFKQIVGAAASFGCFACLATVPGLGQEHVLREAPMSVRLTDRQANMLALAKASAAATGVAMRQVRPRSALQHILADAASDRITLSLSEETVLTATRSSVAATADAGGAWRGTVDGTGGQVTLLWWADGQMAGTVQHEGRFYSIRPMGGELHAVVELNGDLMPPEHQPQMLASIDDRFGQPSGPLALGPVAAEIFTPAPPPGVRGPNLPSSHGGRPKALSGDVTLDVMVAYTRKAAASYSNIERELIELAIVEANQSFGSSNLAHVKLRLVHSYATDYVEDGTHFDHVWRLADKGDGYLEEVHPLRDKHRADLVVLVVDDAQGCGLATRVHADADEAFAVVHHECAATSHSMAHEIGHIIGARHDLSADTIMTPFPYGHGYINGTKWRDIMSLKDSCGGCPRVPVWSSPTVLVRGEPAGTPELDNARVIAEQAARVAAFR